MQVLSFIPDSVLYVISGQNSLYGYVNSFRPSDAYMRQ